MLTTKRILGGAVILLPFVIGAIVSINYYGFEDTMSRLFYTVAPTFVVGLCYWAGLSLLMDD